LYRAAREPKSKDIPESVTQYRRWMGAPYR
jgi:hypothetical protein